MKTSVAALWLDLYHGTSDWKFEETIDNWFLTPNQPWRLYQHKNLNRIRFKKTTESCRKAEFLAAGEACKAKFWPTPGLPEGTFDSSGLSAKGMLTCVSAICDRGIRARVVERIKTQAWLTIGGLSRGGGVSRPRGPAAHGACHRDVVNGDVTQVASTHCTFKRQLCTEQWPTMRNLKPNEVKRWVLVYNTPTSPKILIHTYL